MEQLCAVASVLLIIIVPKKRFYQQVSCSASLTGRSVQGILGRLILLVLIELGQD